MTGGWEGQRSRRWVRVVGSVGVLLAFGWLPLLPLLWAPPASAAPVTVTAAGGPSTPGESSGPGAAGNSAMARDIVTHPVPGWNAVSPVVLDPLAARLQQTESNLTRRQALVAIDGWTNAEHTGSLVVLLVQFGGALQGPRQATRAAALDGCASATGQRALSTTTVPSIAGSTEAICTVGGSTYDGAVVTWLQGDVLADVQGIGGQALTTSQIVAIAQRQDRELSSSLMATAGKSRLIVRSALAAVALLALVAAGVLVVRYLRRPAPAPEPLPARFDWTASQYPDVSPYPGVPPSGPDGRGPPQAGIPPFTTPHIVPRGPIPVPELLLVPSTTSAPATTAPATVAVGWHPIDGDAAHVRFWDGRQWTTRLRWTGTAWTEVPS